VQAHFHTISADPPIGTLSGSSSSGRLAGHEIVGGDTCEESCAEQRNDDNPKFQFLPGALSGEEIKGIQSFADENLGLDESSVYFMRRRKAIAFVFVLLGRVYSLEQNYFVQNESYNDFSGGMPTSPIPPITWTTKMGYWKGLTHGDCTGADPEPPLPGWRLGSMPR